MKTNRQIAHEALELVRQAIKLLEQMGPETDQKTWGLLNRADGSLLAAKSDLINALSVAS